MTLRTRPDDPRPGDEGQPAEPIRPTSGGPGSGGAVTGSGSSPAGGSPEPAAAGTGASGAMPAGAGDPAPARRLAWLTGSGTAAVLTWLIATPVAFALPTLTHRSPFSVGASTIPLTAAFCLILAVAVVSMRWSGEITAGVAAGLTAAWTVLMLRLALHGTPFGFGGLQGDMSRTAASATRYTATIASSDSLDPHLPSEYPPLYTWLIGRAAVLLDQPAWRLLADAEVLVVSLAVLAGFLMWRRLVPAWVALAISTLGIITWSDPRKAYEMLTLAIFVPWALELFARPPRRMHWLPAGLLGGLVALVYQAWIVYAALGILALVVIAWRTEPDRWAYLRRIVLAVAVAVVVASWYVLPFGWATLTRGGQQISDLYASTSINSGLFPFLDVKPLGLLQLVGLIGLIWLGRSVWWARPILLMIAAVYAYRFLSMLRYVGTDHTGFLHYTARLYSALFTIAGVLVLAHVTPLLLRRLRASSPRFAGAVTLGVLLAWSANSFTTSWMPEDGNLFAAQAHTEPLPGGGYPVYAPKDGRAKWFPVDQVRQAVEGVTGPNPRRITLANDARLYAYLPWPGFIDNNRTAGSTLSRWDDRRAVLRELGSTNDPAAFAGRSADTGFGSIDVFVLTKADGAWTWTDQRFRPEQFDPRYWTVIDNLPADVVVAVRR